MPPYQRTVMCLARVVENDVSRIDYHPAIHPAFDNTLMPERGTWRRHVAEAGEAKARLLVGRCGLEQLLNGVGVNERLVEGAVIG